MKYIDNPELINKIEKAIETLRPFFEKDQGDIRLVGIDENMIVRVRLLGACKTCSINDLTLKAGIEDAVRKVVPEVMAVEAVED